MPAGSDKHWWENVLAVAASLGGVGALVYVIGAATLWLRYRLVGLPADIIVTHESRPAVIALGLRGVLAFLSVLIVLALLSFAIAYGSWRWWAHRKLTDDQRKVEFQKRFVDVVKARLRRSRPRNRRWLAGVGIAAILGCAMVSWRALAVAVAVVLPLGAGMHALRLHKRHSGWPLLSTSIVLIFAAVVAGFSWQITGIIPVQGVYLNPPLPNITEAVPYFGETDKYVYVGVIVRNPPGTGTPYEYCHEVMELDRSKVRLTFAGPPQEFHRVNQAPGEALYHLVFRPAGLQPSPPSGCRD